MTVVSGDVSSPNEVEQEALEPEEIGRGVRLACQTTVRGDCVVEIPPETHVIGTKSLDGDLVRPVPLKPNVSQVRVTVRQPSLEDQRADFDRLAEELELTVPPV